MQASVPFGSAVSPRRRRVTAATALLVVAVAAAGTVAVRRSGAETAPLPGVPRTVSADALPTWQINGVVWSQVTIGDTVYATGAFTRTRPPGAAPGTREVVRRNLLAYSISTGNLVTAFNHQLNGRGLVVSKSPDNTRVYVGGDFTTVDGIPRSHVAAFDVATGTLVPGFAPVVSAQVRAIAATSTYVYVGGNFFKANGVNRTRLASFAAGTGRLSAWAPTADDGMVRAMVISPDSTRVIVGGHFTTLNGAPAFGMGSVSLATGRGAQWLANQTIKDAGANGAITTLETDGRMIYGGGYAYGQVGVNFEGTFAADPTTGTIAWLNDCHGDTYDVLPIGSVLYHAGHSHDCSAIGSFPDTSKPRTWWHTVAESTTAGTAVNTGPDSYGWDYSGWKASTTLHWNPQYGIGTYTGQAQAAWSVTGNGSYLAVGGEFPTVNGKPQQGLVRFALSSRAPNKMGPRPFAGLRPRLSSPAPGTVNLAFQATWDADNTTLKYKLVRDTGHVVTVKPVDSRPWSLPTITVTDTGVPKGAHTYYLEVVDPFNNRVLGTRSPAITVG